MIKVIINTSLLFLMILGTGFVEGDRMLLGVCLGIPSGLILLVYNFATMEQ